MVPILFDTDPGVDDALALLWLLRCGTADVRAVTTVSGNIDLDRATTNALKLLELADSEAPVYRGADAPLEGEALRASYVHGEDGLGETQLPTPTRRAETEGAAEAICRSLNEDPDLSLVAVGPLTNLALAEQRQPGILRRARQVAIMGGAIDTHGNVSATAEFNIASDPLAARIVLQSGAAIRLVPLDVTRQVLLRSDGLDPLGDDPVVSACRDAIATPVRVGRERYGYDGVYLHDPLTAMLAVEPGLATWESLWLDVETSGMLTRGQIVVDRRPGSARQGTEVQVAMAVESAEAMRRFVNGLAGAEGATG